jgi:molecular chaperone GrpE
MKNNKQHKKPDTAEEAITMTKAEYDALKAAGSEKDNYYDKYLRAQADLENARRRMEKEKLDFLRYANESFALDLLPILDNLETAERHIKEAKDFKAVQEGIDMIQLQIQKFLKDIGLERIKTSGEKFDPNVHEAIETAQAPDKEDGTIIEELKPGYKLNGKLLRPAVVRVVKKTIVG